MAIFLARADRKQTACFRCWNRRSCCCYFHVSFVGLKFNCCVKKTEAVSSVGVLFCPLLFPKKPSVTDCSRSSFSPPGSCCDALRGGGIAVAPLTLGASHAEHVAEWLMLRCASVDLFPTSFPRGKHSLLQIPSQSCSYGHAVSLFALTCHRCVYCTKKRDNNLNYVLQSWFVHLVNITLRAALTFPLCESAAFVFVFPAWPAGWRGVGTGDVMACLPRTGSGPTGGSEEDCG